MKRGIVLPVGMALTFAATCAHADVAVAPPPVIAPPPVVAPVVAPPPVVAPAAAGAAPLPTPADLKSGKFIESGLSAGVGAAVLFPTRTNPGLKEITGLIAVPYLMVTPAYWTFTGPHKAYCAAHFFGSDDQDQENAAVAQAKPLATEIYNDVLNALKTGSPAPSIKTQYLRRFANPNQLPYDDADIIIATIDNIRQGVAGAPSSDDEVVAISHQIWNPTKGAYCWLTWMSAWVGLPTAFSAETVIDESNGAKNVLASRSVAPKFGLGVAYTPNAYFSVMTGFTYSDVPQANVVATSTTPAISGAGIGMWNFMVGLGGNIDIINLFKGS